MISFAWKLVYFVIACYLAAVLYNTIGFDANLLTKAGVIVAVILFVFFLSLASGDESMLARLVEAIKKIRK